MTMTFVVGIDQGTTGTKAYRLVRRRTVRALCAMEHRQIYPRPGWVEHDGRELLACVMRCLACGRRRRGQSESRIKGETVIAVGRRQRRTGLQCHRLAGQPHAGRDGAVEGRRRRAHDPRARRAAARSVFLRLEAELDPRQCAGCSAARRAADACGSERATRSSSTACAASTPPTSPPPRAPAS